MRETLCPHLCCPTCRGVLDLQVEDREGPHILTGTLRCESCDRWYPIAGGVPRFVDRALEAEQAATAIAFGRSWRIWRQIDDERYRHQLLEWLTPMQPEDFAGRRVLDAGCGKGRHLRIMAEFGVSDVIGVDISDAVDIAYEHTHHLEHVHVIQADLMHSPFHGGFDVAYSIGVLHHTPDPAAAFEAVGRQVRPGGRLACWVYGRENNGWIVSLVNPIRLCVTRYLPTWAVHGLATLLTVVLFLMIYAVYVPVTRLGGRLFYQSYMMNLKQLGVQECRHIVFDHLIAPTTFYLRRSEIEGWFDKSDLRETSLSWIHHNSWAGIGTRTAA